MSDANEKLVPVQFEVKIKERLVEIVKEREYLETAFEAANEAGEATERVKHGSSAPLRVKVEELCAAQHDKECEQQALTELLLEYECWSLTAFDFDAYIKKKKALVGKFLPVDLGPLRAFDAAVRGGDVALGDDEDLMVVGGGANGFLRNAKCPLSLKKLEDLNEPLEDSKGYVYEAAAIIDYIGRKTSVQCPVAGTTHTVKRAELKPSRHVMRLKARREAGSDAGYGDSQCISP